MKRAAVVGGGLAGCAAAVRLAKRGWAVTLLERHPRLGGKVSSFRHRGHWVDNGQHVATKACTAFRGFLAEIGAADRMRWQERLRIPFVSRGGHLTVLERRNLPSPFHLLHALFSFNLLDWPARLGLRRVLEAAPAAASGIDGNTFRMLLEGLGQGEAAVRRFWDPLAYAVCNASSAEIGARTGAWVVREGLCGRSDALDLGIATVPQAELVAPGVTRYLAGRSGTVRTGTLAEGIVEQDGRVVGVRLRGGELLEADAVVVAVPWDAVAGILPERLRAVPAVTGLSRFRPGAILSVTLRLDRPVLPEGEEFVALVETPVQWAFSRTRLRGLDPKGGEILNLVVSGANALMGSSLEGLVAMARTSLETCLPRMAGARILDAVVMKEKRATWLPVPGSALLQPTPAFPLGSRQILLAGVYTATGWPATMEGAVRSGNLAAEVLLTGDV